MAHIVIDVPETAEIISYGVFIVGTGFVWIDNARLDVVPEGTALTGPPREMTDMPPRRILPGERVSAPSNLGFEAAESDSTRCP